RVPPAARTIPSAQSPKPGKALCFPLNPALATITVDRRPVPRGAAPRASPMFRCRPGLSSDARKPLRSGSMAKGRGDFTDILVKKQVLSPDQLAEARSLQQQTGAKLQETLVKLGYCGLDDVMNAVAEFHGMQFVN